MPAVWRYRKLLGKVLLASFTLQLFGSDITAEQVVEAARMAAAHDFISELSQGYESSIGERGTGLSGGQGQRIALARLFLSQAPLLV